MQYGTLRKLDMNTFSSGQMVPTKINNVEYGRELLLYLSGVLTTGTTPTIGENSPMGLIKAIDLIGSAAGGDTTKNGSLHRISGIDLFALNAFETGSWPWVQRHGASNTTAYPFGCVLMLPFTPYPTDSLNLLPHPAFNSLELDVTWGALADMGGGGIGTFTTTPTLTIYESTRIAPPTATVPSMMKTVSKYSTLNASSTDGNDIDIKTGLPLEKALVRVSDNSIRSDTFVTGLTVIENDSKLHINAIPWTVMQAYNRYRALQGAAMGYPMVEAADNNTATAVGLGVTNALTMKGFVMIDFVDLEGFPISVPGAADTFKLRLFTTTSAGGTPNATVVLRQRIG
jgi:hypothetical protein